MNLRALYTAATLSLLFAGCTKEAELDEAQVVEAICCGANCCFINGACRQRGARNPADMCEQCNPSTNQTDWSPVAGCGADAGFPDAAAPDAAPPADAGFADADPNDTGSGNPDAQAAPDAAPPADSGVVTMRDAGTGSARDAGNAVEEDSGCACVASRQIGAGSFALLMLGAMLILRRRTR